MTPLVFLTILFLQFASRFSGADDPSSRSKRNVINLYDMVSAVTKTIPFSIIGYGCYCFKTCDHGKPLDATDRCCQKHNECADKMIGNWCIPYMTDYKYSCNGKKCTCDAGNGSCAAQACKCDTDFANCLANSTSTFNWNYVNYDASKC